MPDGSLPAHRAGNCGVQCSVEPSGLPRCTNVCQQLRWDYVDHNGVEPASVEVLVAEHGRVGEREGEGRVGAA